MARPRGAAGNGTWGLGQRLLPAPHPQDGVILGADTRATNDSVVADKICEKIHFIAPKI